MIITASPERQDMSGLFGGSCTRLVMGSDFAIYQQLSHGQLPRSWRSWMERASSYDVAQPRRGAAGWNGVPATTWAVHLDGKGCGARAAHLRA